VGIDVVGNVPDERQLIRVGKTVPEPCRDIRRVVLDLNAELLSAFHVVKAPDERGELLRCERQMRSFVTAGPNEIHFHRYHRDPLIHSATRGRFFALADCA
jgi:hypothetical protein